MSVQTAILIFAHTAAEEVLHKPIDGGYQLFSALNSTIEKVVQSTKIPYFFFTEAQQEGNNFGERFTHAIQAIYQQGYDNVIAIGNDTPFITKEHLLQSVDALEQNKQLVIGPSVDGGFYLIGIHKTLFQSIDFLALPWQSRKLTKHIIHLLAHQTESTVFKLPMLYDIDSIEDLKKIHSYTKKLSRILLQIIRNILAVVSHQQFSLPKRYQADHLFISYNKGSPYSTAR